MITEIDKEIDLKHQLNHCFKIHKEYIDYFELEYDEENEKSGSYYHPLFINLDELIASTGQIDHP